MTEWYSATSIIWTLFIRTLSSPAMYLCACVEGVTFCIQWVWLMLNEGARYVCWVKMLEMTNEDASKNPF